MAVVTPINVGPILETTDDVGAELPIDRTEILRKIALLLQLGLCKDKESSRVPKETRKEIKAAAETGSILSSNAVSAVSDAPLSFLRSALSHTEIRVLYYLVGQVNDHPSMADLHCKLHALIEELIREEGDESEMQSPPTDSMMASFSAAYATRDEAREAGRAIYSLLKESGNLAEISTDCKNALAWMKNSGVPMSVDFIQELYKSESFAKCLKVATPEQLEHLRSQLSAAAVSTSRQELLAVWSVVNSVAMGVIGSQLARQSPLDSDTVRGPSVTPQSSDMKILGSILQFALAGSMALCASLSIEVQEEIREMIEDGKQLSSNAVHELQENGKELAKTLPIDKLKVLQAKCIETAMFGEAFVQDIGAFIGKKVEAATTNIGELHQTAVDVFQSPPLKIIADTGMKGVNAWFTSTKEQIDSAVDTIMYQTDIAGCISSVYAALPSLLRLEIFRDFGQTVGLLFSRIIGTILQEQGLKILQLIDALITSFYDIVLLNAIELWRDHADTLRDIGFGLMIVIFILGYFIYLWFAKKGRYLHSRAEEIRFGHEAQSWATLAKEQSRMVRFVTFILTMCLTIYLPLTRLCVEVLLITFTSGIAASTEEVEESDILVRRYLVGNLGYALSTCASVVLLTFSIPLPLLLVDLVKKNRPRGSREDETITYDEEGRKVPFTDKEYARLVAEDPGQRHCPYRSLYSGFEQKWSHYKVLMLLAKTFLMLPLVLIERRDARGCICAVLYAGIFGLTVWSTPFCDPLNDKMELSGKLAALVTAVGGTVLAFLVSDDDSEPSTIVTVVGLIVHVVNIINLLFMIALVIFGMSKFRVAVKNLFGSLTFSDTTRRIMDAPHKHIMRQWDEKLEIKRRVWQTFWKALLLSVEEQQTGVVGRLKQLEDAVRESGMENIREHIEGETHGPTSQLRLAARTLLEGVDVYWDDPTGTRDGHLDSQTYFGKLYIHPYPFHCVMVYDDCNDEAILRPDKLEGLLAINFSPAICDKRLVRQKLRCLDNAAALIEWPFERTETARVEDGTETYTVTDSDGNSKTKTRTRYSNVSFTCYYTNGVIKVGSSSSKFEMASGFDVNMTYRDGHGVAVAPHTGKHHELNNRLATMPQTHIGLTNEMIETDVLGQFFCSCQTIWEPGLPVLRSQHQKYRNGLLQKHAKVEEQLGNGFWYYVYNNALLSRGELVSYMAKKETNLVLKHIFESNTQLLDILYQRLNFIHSHPVRAYWYVFWDDVYARNREMSRLKPYESELSPYNLDSICYKPMEREQLEAWLTARRLRGWSPSIFQLLLLRKSLFHDRLLDELYLQLDNRKHKGLK